MVQHINPEKITSEVVIKPGKLNDVKQLLDKHYGHDWANKYEYLRFYKSVLNIPENVNNNNDDFEAVVENDIEEVLDFV